MLSPTTQLSLRSASLPYVFFSLLGLNAGLLYMLGKHFTTEVHPQPLYLVFTLMPHSWTLALRQYVSQVSVTMTKCLK
jgi:hypothetical protein